jgi:predicted nucleotide-binding protein
MSDRATRAQDTIAELRAELKEIFERAEHDKDFDSARERIIRWKERAVEALADKVHPREAQRLQQKRKSSFVMGQPLRNLADELRMYDAFLGALSEEIAAQGDRVFEVPVPASIGVDDAQAAAPTTSNVVFLIHGHDELNVLRLKELLRDRWNLEAVVLGLKPGKGRTLIEKFEEEAQRAVFALALFTPDDVVNVEGEEYSQPRPNASFELGWFYGRLGRQRVCILFKRGTRIHSDLDGISRIEFGDSILEKVDELERELLDAGIVTR